MENAESFLNVVRFTTEDKKKSSRVDKNTRKMCVRREKKVLTLVHFWILDYRSKKGFKARKSISSKDQSSAVATCEKLFTSICLELFSLIVNP